MFTFANNSIAGIEEGRDIASRNLKSELPKIAAEKKELRRKKEEVMAALLQANPTERLRQAT